MNGDDGSEAVPARVARDEQGVSPCACSPTPISVAAFPTAASASIRRPARDFERVGGDELLFADGRSRGQPFLVFVTARDAIARAAHHRAAA